MCRPMQEILNTPLIRFDEISKKMRVDVYGKIETGNPTGSHKDRETMEIISDVRRKGHKAVGCASTGNAAISLAAYSRMTDIICHIYVSEKIGAERMNLIRMFSPRIHIVHGAYEEAIRQSNLEMSQEAIYNANPGRCYSKVVGDSYIGKEIAAEIQPDFVTCPTNNGTLFAGVWSGLKASKVKPTMVAATAKNTEIADSIKGFHRLEEPALPNALKESNGIVIDVTDAEIEEANWLLFDEGVIAEPASAASIAAINSLEFTSEDVICCVITGSALKFPRTMIRSRIFERSSV